MPIALKLFMLRDGLRMLASAVALKGGGPRHPKLRHLCAALSADEALSLRVALGVDPVPECDYAACVEAARRDLSSTVEAEVPSSALHKLEHGDPAEALLQLRLWFQSEVLLPLSERPLDLGAWLRTEAPSSVRTLFLVLNGCHAAPAERLLGHAGAEADLLVPGWMQLLTGPGR